MFDSSLLRGQGAEEYEMSEAVFRVSIDEICWQFFEPKISSPETGKTGNNMKTQNVW